MLLFLQTYFKMESHFLILFLIFHIFYGLWAQDVDENAHCHGNELKRMETFTFDSLEENGRKIQILKAHGQMGAGNVSNVFIGYNGTKDEKFSSDKCVAIKLTPKAEENLAKNGFKTIETIKMVLPAKERQHIIETFHLGRTETHFVTVMELADGSHRRMYVPVNFEVNNDEPLERAIFEFVKPLEKLHRVAVHLDLKRVNYLYVNKKLKLIDFDSSNLLDQNETDRNNLEVQPIWPIYGIYVAPEYDREVVKVSTKMDIWIVGLLVFELALFQPRHNLEEKELYGLVRSIGDIYRGNKYLDHDGPERTKQKQDLAFNEQWLQEYIDAVWHVLDLRQAHPRIFLLITNLLQKDGPSRMSAVGIFVYFANKCMPKVELYDNYKMALFNGITNRKLKALIRKAMANGGPRDSKKLKEMEKMLLKGTASMTRLLRGMARQKTPCEH